MSKRDLVDMQLSYLHQAARAILTKIVDEAVVAQLHLTGRASDDIRDRLLAIEFYLGAIQAMLDIPRNGPMRGRPRRPRKEAR